MSIVRCINDRNRSYARLHEAIHYVTREGNVPSEYIEGIGINPEKAYEEMTAAKAIFHKETGKQYLHLVVSCGKEVKDRSLAHEVAKRMAEYFKDYQVLLATHGDTKNYHSHLIVNSVNMNTGKKLSQNRQEFRKFRAFANTVFVEFGLPEIGKKDMYEIIIDNSIPFAEEYFDEEYTDEDYDEYSALIDDFIDAEQSELEKQTGKIRPIYFTDPDMEREDKIRSIKRLTKYLIENNRGD